MQTIEERLDQLEKRNKRLTAALAVLGVAICAVVTMAATGAKDGEFDKVWADTVVAKSVYTTNDANKIVATLGSNDAGHGLIQTMSAQGKDMVMLGSTDTGGAIAVFNKTGEGVVQLRADEYGNGVVYAGNRKGEGRTLQPGP